MPSPLKILHVIPSIALAHGGPSVVLRTMARSQAERGMEVHVATTDANGVGHIDAKPGTSFVEDNVTYWVFHRQTQFYTFSFPLSVWLWRHARDYDLIHIHALFSYPSIAAAFCAKRFRIPYVVRPLGVLSQWSMQHRKPWLKKLSFRFIESHILRHAAGVQYTSEQESKEAEQLGVKHIPVLVPNPVDLADPILSRGNLRAAYPELAGKTIVLFLSRIDIKKGIELLLKAFVGVLKQCPNAVLVLAGDGDQTLVKALKEQGRQLGLDRRILWVGFLQGQSKQGALADADIFVLPSRSENFGVAVVEAMGAGLPVIVSDEVGIHPEITGARAGIVIQCSAAQLESALIKLIDDASLRLKMAGNARQLAQKFSPREVAEQLATAYAQIQANYVRPVTN